MKDFDVIVIGSGAGGAAVAVRTCAAGLRTLVLEKGTTLPTDGSTLDLQRVVHRGEFLSRETWVDGVGRALTPEEHFNVGGKTRWYGAALLRFSPHEFAADPAHDCRAWPIEYRQLAPYYEAAEALLGVRYVPIEPALERIVERVTARANEWRAQPMPMALAPDITSDPHEAAYFDGFASVKGLKYDAENRLLAVARATGMLTLRTNAEVTELLGGAASPATIEGVRLADGAVVRARTIVLAAGALHSPRILKRYLAQLPRSTSRPALAHVGGNLKMHLLTAMVALSPSRKSDLIRKTTVLLNERFPHSSVQPLGFDAELIGTLMPSFVPRPIARQMGARAYGFFLQTEDGSALRNHVDEVQDDRTLKRVLDYDSRRTPAAAREHRRFTHALQLALLRAGLVSFTKRIGLAGTAHACGTLIAGTAPADSVVDPAGIVHGLQGVYVADGSVLPRSSRVNPSLTIFAWGLRVGEYIARTNASTTISERSRSDACVSAI